MTVKYPATLFVWAKIVKNMFPQNVLVADRFNRDILVINVKYHVDDLVERVY